MKHLSIASLILASSFFAQQASAQAPTLRLTAASAEAIIDGCVAYANENDLRFAIAVFDSGVDLAAFLKMDGARPGNVSFALAKAKGVAMWQFPTSRMEQGVKSTPGFDEAEGVITVAGGVPVFSQDGKTFLGSAAASGAAAAIDEACIEAGIEAAGLKHQRA